jgi:hypothetical protein
MNNVIRSITVEKETPDEAIAFIKEMRFKLRELRRAFAYPNRLVVADVNGDALEIRGIGYADPAIVPILMSVNAVFDPQSIHEPCAGECKEIATGRRYTWAQDRCM